MTVHTPTKSSLPLYRQSIDWARFDNDLPPPDLFEQGVYRWSAERVHDLQNRRFMRIVAIGWENDFYRRCWSAAGLEPGDIKSIDDSNLIPTFTSEDIKADQAERPPFGSIHGPGLARFPGMPLKLQTSGGTTGKPRPTLFGPIEWEMNALSAARALYIQGGRPGDILQNPATCSLANYPWGVYQACHSYLGILPLTTGSGIVTPSRRQLEIAEEWGTTIWHSFPEYLTQLAKVYRAELGRDVRDLGTKFIGSFLGPDVENSLRRQVEELWGCPVYDNYGTHEIGFGAFECRHQSGLHLHEDINFFEFADVDSGKDVPVGQTGNLVVTSLYRETLPIIRFNLRDLTRVVGSTQCDCGSSFRRMDKFLGRSDDMIKLRGVNIYPMACLPAVKCDSRTTGEWVCVVERHVRDGVIRDEMTVRVEVRRDAGDTEGLSDAVERRLHTDLGVKVAVDLVPEGSLAEVANLGREGKPRRLLDKRYAAAEAGRSA